jgi:hypothetical protein
MLPRLKVPLVLDQLPQYVGDFALATFGPRALPRKPGLGFAPSVLRRCLKRAGTFPSLHPLGKKLIESRRSKRAKFSKP